MKVELEVQLHKRNGKSECHVASVGEHGQTQERRYEFNPAEKDWLPRLEEAITRISPQLIQATWLLDYTRPTSRLWRRPRMKVAVRSGPLRLKRLNSQRSRLSNSGMIPVRSHGPLLR